MKKTIFYFLFSIFSLLALPFSLSAMGGGGGGSATCSSDTWVCTQWDTCTTAGSQTRRCELNFDCPDFTTPRPAEMQACIPPCADDEWLCTEWSKCSSLNRQARECTLVKDCPTAVSPDPELERTCDNAQSATPEPATPAVEAPDVTVPTPAVANPAITRQKNCTVDTWDCGNWSDTCDRFGNHKRFCRRTFDCSSVDTPQPPAFKRCESLQCEGSSDMHERIVCRLKLADSGLAREEEQLYLPEECRAYTDETRRLCVDRYRSYQACWNLPFGERRNDCAKDVLEIRAQVAQIMSDCVKLAGQEAESCKSKLRAQVYEMVKFRLYDLEERAEELVEEGVSEESVADFVQFTIEKKQAFTRAQTKDERRQIVLDVREGWRRFISEAKKQINSP